MSLISMMPVMLVTASMTVILDTASMMSDVFMVAMIMTFSNLKTGIDVVAKLGRTHPMVHGWTLGLDIPVQRRKDDN